MKHSKNLYYCRYVMTHNIISEHTLTPAEVDEMLNEFDKDKDGKIRYEGV